jgi:hypothetical protein
MPTEARRIKLNKRVNFFMIINFRNVKIQKCVGKICARLKTHPQRTNCPGEWKKIRGHTQSVSTMLINTKCAI